MRLLDQVVARVPRRRPRPAEPFRALAYPADITAWKRPQAVAMVWLFELVASFVIATPVHAWARAAFARHPDGDASLFRSFGGLPLVEWVSLSEPTTLGIVLRISVVLILLFGVASQVATGAVVTSLATRGGKPMQMGVAAFFPLLVVDIFFGLIEGGCFGLGFYLSSSLDHAMQHAFGDERAFLGRLVVLGAAVAMTLAVGVVGDLARVAVARDIALGKRRNLYKRAIRSALRARLRDAWFGWTWRIAGSLSLIVIGAALSDRLTSVWLLFVIHQLTILGRAALRTSWLAKALRLVVAVEDAEEPAAIEDSASPSPSPSPP